MNLFEITSEGFSIILPKILDILNLEFCKSENLIPVTLSIAFSEYENFRFPFIAKTEQLKIGREMRKFNFRKSEEIIR